MCSGIAEIAPTEGSLGAVHAEEPVRAVAAERRRGERRVRAHGVLVTGRDLERRGHEDLTRADGDVGGGGGLQRRLQRRVGRNVRGRGRPREHRQRDARVHTVFGLGLPYEP